MDKALVGPIRNIAFVSNVGAGKTALSEAILFVAGVIPNLGSVLQGTTVSDFEPEELHHGHSVSTGLLQFTWNETHLNLLDPPGALSLIGEPLAALQSVDAVVVILDATSGVRTELSRLWDRIKDLALPTLFFVNGLDREGASIEAALGHCRKHFDCTPIPMVVPVYSDANLDGMIDVLQGTFLRSHPTSSKVEHEPIPAHLETQEKHARKQLVEAIAESDEALLEAYVEQGDLDPEQILEGLRAGILVGRLSPLYAGSAIRNIGVWSLLNAIVRLLPSPVERGSASPYRAVHPDSGDSQERTGSVQEPFSAYVFKTLIDPFVGRLSYCRLFTGAVRADSTVWNPSKRVHEKLGHFYSLLGKRHVPVEAAKAGDIIAIGKLRDTQTGDTICQEHDPICYPRHKIPRPVLSFAIEAKSKTEIDKVSLGLHKLIEEDPTLEFSRNPETKEMVLSGMGQLHIDLALEKLHRKFGADVTLHTPKIPYRETLQIKSQAQGKYKKQTGGHGQYGDCWLEVTPLSRGEGFVFENRIVGGAIPRNFIPAVEKGVLEAMHEGGLSGYPVVDVQVTVYDGSYHVVDSSEMSFKIAASMAFKKAMEGAHPVLLEPMMNIEVEAPTDVVGAVMGDLNARRGRILSVSASDHSEQIKALVPLAELLKYAPALNSMTGGRGSYGMEFSGYSEVPRELATRIIEQHKTERHAMATR